MTLSTLELARRYGVSPQTIGQHLRAAGMTPTRTRKDGDTPRGIPAYWDAEAAVAALDAVRCGQPGKPGKPPGGRATARKN